jgi:superfamily II DNA or RNA helicase
MNQNKGYIYIRNHYSYDCFNGINACKIGKTINIPERDTQYATGEIKRGYFETVFEVSLNQMGIIERLLQYEFRHLNIKYDAGSEFYDKKIITLIEPYLTNKGIYYKKLTIDEIGNLLRINRIKKITGKINKKELIKFLKSNGNEKNLYKPRIYQTEIINKAINYFQQNSKGLLILVCGIGKTLISLWIAKELKLNTILIGVPNKELLKQWKEVICELFKKTPFLIISGNTNIKNIIQFLENYKNNCIIITTYSSAYKVHLATKDKLFKFNIKINDECHHLTSFNINEKFQKTFINIFEIKAEKQLSLTATLKLLENKENSKYVVSNDTIHYFGEIIEKKCLLWAINENIVCDYVIQTIITNEEQLDQNLTFLNIYEKTEKKLFLSAFASLKSIFEGHSHHLLIYSNNKENSLKIIDYVKIILDNGYFNLPNLYYSNYHGEMKSIIQNKIIDNFKKAIIGIIACVYCLGEGWDFPLLDGVVFAENMSSNIRIYQSALRVGRKNKHQSDKIAKIILPVINEMDWFGKVKEVIYQMGLEDETIAQKIKVYKITIEKQKPKQREKEERKIINEFGEYDDELTQKLRLKTIKRNALAITYEKAKKILADKKLKNKESYYELCERDNRLSKEPELEFKGQFTNWIDYLNIERNYYDLETCKNKVGEYLLLYPEIKKYYLDLSIVINELCKKDILFPPNGLWVEYYNVKDLKDIITITNKKKTMGIIL